MDDLPPPYKRESLVYQRLIRGMPRDSIKATLKVVLVSTPASAQDVHVKSTWSSSVVGTLTVEEMLVYLANVADVNAFYATCAEIHKRQEAVSQQNTTLPDSVSTDAMHILAITAATTSYLDLFTSEVTYWHPQTTRFLDIVSKRTISLLVLEAIEEAEVWMARHPGVSFSYLRPLPIPYAANLVIWALFVQRCAAYMGDIVGIVPRPCEFYPAPNFIQHVLRKQRAGELLSFFDYTPAFVNTAK